MSNIPKNEKWLYENKEALNQQILSVSHGFNELQIVTNNEA